VKGKGQRRMDERLCLPSRTLRRTPLEESLRTSQLSAYELVDRFSVDGLAGKSSQDGLHHTAHILRRRRAGLLNSIRNGLLDYGWLSSSGQVCFKDLNLGALFIGQFEPATLRELLDGIFTLFYE